MAYGVAVAVCSIAIVGTTCFMTLPTVTSKQATVRTGLLRRILVDAPKRDDMLNREWFRSRAEAKVLMERWRQFSNERRPHSAHRY